MLQDFSTRILCDLSVSRNNEACAEWLRTNIFWWSPLEMLFYFALSHPFSLQSPLQASHLQTPGALLFLINTWTAFLLAFTSLLKTKRCFLWHEKLARMEVGEDLRETIAPEPWVSTLRVRRVWPFLLHLDLLHVNTMPPIERWPDQNIWSFVNVAELWKISQG